EGCSLKSPIIAVRVHYVVIQARENCFHADSRYDHVLPDDGLLSKVSVDSLPQCAQECLYLSDCFSVFFTAKGKCFTYSTRMDDFIPTVEKRSSKYYELKGKYGNVAAGKTAVQSSTFPPFSGIYEAYKAVDDSRYPVAVQPGDSCACTGLASDEFWRVDLSDTYLIRDVAVLQRHDDTAGTSSLNIKIMSSSILQGLLILTLYPPLNYPIMKPKAVQERKF
ncbi:uncharacterized protein, partial [Argopecten irradians]|uniref:uncharacterized protein n=1 Tax=Argopecten irradians TaxID=31199 RepID=UPI003720853C